MSVKLDVNWMDPGRVRGKPTLFREGTLILSPAGVTVVGKRVLPDSYRMAAVFGLLLTGVGVLIGVLALEHLVRLARVEQHTWDEADEIVFEPQSFRVGFVIRSTERDRVESLVTRMEPQALHQFLAAMHHQFGPDRVKQGKILPGLPKWIPVVVLLGLAIAFAVGVAIVIALD